MTLSWELKKCDNPPCLRQVRVVYRYCCMPCEIAHGGQFEIHEHTSLCDARDTERGPYVDPWSPESRSCECAPGYVVCDVCREKHYPPRKA
jgi:hypothetical protein